MLNALTRLENILFTDIATSMEYAELSELPPALSQFWKNKLDREPEEDPEIHFLKKASLFAEISRVQKIELGFFSFKDQEITLRIKTIKNIDEQELLSEFAVLLQAKRFSKKELFLCAHNGKSFDFPFLGRRYLINGLPLPKTLDLRGLKPWEIRHIDTMEQWRFGERGYYISLQALAETLGIKPNDYLFPTQANHEEYQPPKGNAALTAQVYLRLLGLPQLEKEKIVFVE